MNNEVKINKNAEYVKSFYIRHPEKRVKLKLYHDRWRKKNRERMNEKMKEVRNNNIERYRKYCRDYYYRNRDCILTKLKMKYHAFKSETQKFIIPPPEITEKKQKMVSKTVIGKTRLKQRTIDNNLKKVQLKKEQYLATLLTNTKIE